MMKRVSCVSLALLALGGLLAGCGGDEDEGGGAAGAAQATIDPKLSVIQTEILDKSCAFSSCHGAGAVAPEMTAGKSRANLVDRASNFEAGKQLVVPGKPDESLLYLVLKGSVGQVNQMPKGSKLDDAKVEAVRKWIADGALDN
jgi:hypothetical protein